MDRHMNILVVDESATVRWIVRHFLAELGLEMSHEASDGAAALALLDREDFDLVITGCQLADTSGAALARAVRAHPLRAGLPVLAIGAQPPGPRSGLDGWICTPFTAQTLREALERIAERLPA